MNVKSRNFIVAFMSVLVIGGGTLGAAAMRTQSSNENDSLPPGFSLEPNTGNLIVTAPPAVQFNPEQNKDRVLDLTSSLSIRSLSLDQTGKIMGYTTNALLGDYPDGTVLMCRSVTLNDDGTLDELVLAESMSGTCEMKVVIGPGTTTYSCSLGSCTTSCDIQMVKDPITGNITVTCDCAATP